MLKRNLILMIVFGLLFGCGFKGPLVLPPSSNSSKPTQAPVKPIESATVHSVESVTAEFGNNFESKSY